MGLVLYTKASLTNLEFFSYERSFQLAWKQVAAFYIYSIWLQGNSLCICLSPFKKSLKAVNIMKLKQLMSSKDCSSLSHVPPWSAAIALCSQVLTAAWGFPAVLWALAWTYCVTVKTWPVKEEDTWINLIKFQSTWPTSATQKPTSCWMNSHQEAASALCMPREHLAYAEH